jgi:isocitrate dehydrogenase kinase/phosphatase
VAEGDVFPEEFGHFLGLSDELRQVFMEYHADLLEVDFWRGMQRCIEQGELVHILPYREDQRLRAGQGGRTTADADRRPPTAGV